jgi:O-antigen ligase
MRRSIVLRTFLQESSDMPSGSGTNPDTSTATYAGDWLNDLGSSGDAVRTPSLSTVGDRQTPLKIAIGAVIAMVMLGPLMTIVEGGGSGEGSVTRQILYLLILGLTIYAIRPTATPRSLVAFTWPLLLAFVWCWASLTWAIDPNVAVRRVFLTTLVAWMVFSLVRHGGYQLNVTILRYALLVSILISYLFVFLDPPIGMHLMLDSDMPTALIGNWRGFLGHKNFAGAVSALCIIMFLFDAKRVRPVVRILVIIVAGYFLFRSQSKTSAGMLVLASLGGIIFETVNLKLRRYLIPMLTIGGSAIWFLTSAYADMVQSNFLNPTAFTGRGQIWSALLRYAADHPLLGAGFGSFWNIEAGSPVFSYGQGYVTTITVGHSGYLDQLVTVGVPGLLLMVFAMAVWPLSKLLISTQIAKGQGALVSAMLMFCIGHNITESGLFERDGIVSTMFFFAAAFAQYCTLGEKITPDKVEAGDDLMRQLRRRKREKRPVLTAGE